jgi:hypothetical protein
MRVSGHNFCHDQARQALYSFYLSLFSTDVAHGEIEFLLSRIVFIQKGRIDADQAGNCRRHPNKTRPLNLANTDCKIISCMVSMVLSVICSSCITSQQAGGMKGSQMIDHIFTLDAKIIDFIIRNVPNSGIFALDIASAFPTLSRKFLFWVLRNMNILPTSEGSSSPFIRHLLLSFAFATYFSAPFLSTLA